MIIYENTFLKIKKKQDGFILKTRYYEKYYDFFNTFLKNVDDSIKMKQIKINVDEINTLSSLLKNNKLSLELFQMIFLFLMKQLKHLEKQNKTILLYNLKDIIYFKVNENYSFYFLNPKHIFPIKNKEIVIDKIFEKNKFISPELDSITEIPSKIPMTNAYWSLAKLMEICLLKMNIDLNYIKHTKLYWAIQRCLVIDPKHRFLLFI